jgi:protein ImuB
MTPTSLPLFPPHPARATARRLVSLWLPRFATDRIGQRGSALRLHPGAVASAQPDPVEERPLVTVIADGSRGLRLAAVDALAAAAGLGPGQALADARALEPGLIVHDAAPASDLAVLAALAGWARRYTPWAATSGLEPGGGGGLWLDISGCAHLFGGEAALLDDLTGRLRRRGYAARAGLADTTGAAWAAARFAETREARPFVIVPPGGQRALLAGLPVASLRLPPATVEALARLGLRRVDDLLRLPRDGLATRFGETVTRCLDQALGALAEPISPRLPAPDWYVALNLAEPLGQPEAIVAATETLVAALCDRLADAGRGARRLELALFRCTGRVDHVAIGTSRPNRDVGHLMRLLGEQLDRLPAPPQDPYGNADLAIDHLTLTALVSEPLTAAQTVFAGATRHADDPADAAALGALVDRLGNRLGADATIRLGAVASHIPERAQRPEPALRIAATRPAGTAAAPALRPAQPRPPRLLPRPEPIEATAPVPDDPPLLFRRGGRAGGVNGGRLHRVVRAEGPERLAPEWWRGDAGSDADDTATTRDYYRVEDSEGRRFWVYREGLYGETADGPAPRWYLHGFFG